ncbi:MAG: caspase family protein, partial [Bacteroidota bacterium]
AVSSDNENGIKLWDMETGRILRSMEGFVQPALAVDAMPDGKHILVGSLDRELTMWDITTGRLVRTFDRSNDVNWIDIANNGKYFVTTAEKTSFFKVWNFKSGRLLKSILQKDRYFNWVKFGESDLEIYARSVSTGDGSIGISMLKSDEEIKLWNRQDGKSKKVKDDSIEALEDKYSSNGYQVSWELDELTLKKGGQTVLSDKQAGHLTDATFSKDGRFLITTNAQGEIAMYDIVSGKKTASMALIGNYDYITYTPDYYYTSSKNAAKAIAFRSKNTILPFEQLELKYNRPDIIASRLGYASDKLVASYRAAFDKRLKRLGLTEQDLNGKLELPEVTLGDDFPLATDQRSFSFSASAIDNAIGLKAVKVFVNDVPVYGSVGKEVSSGAGETITHQANIELSAGINEVKVVAMNKSGLESLPVSFDIKYNAEYGKPTMYLAAIGVSEYQQSDYNLAFAAKDAADMVGTLSGSSGYESIKTKVLNNADATKQNILGLRSFVEQATVDDVVVIFIAGHGVLDKSYNYYFATHDMDFNNPANGGLPYESIEQLIDGIACRNKVLFMDTCHSGELDKDDVADTQKAVVKRGSVAFRSTGTIVQLKENSFGLSNTLELSRTLFGDLKKGTGATIISAAGGTEFAQEGLNSSNGLFTSCLIDGITSRRADINRNRSYSVSELQRYISDQVTLLSGGSQVPTSREENTKNDFRVY